jgi:hypothetical protein
MIEGQVASKSRAGTGIKVGDDWYNGTKEQLAGIEWKDMVRFTVEGKRIMEISKLEATMNPEPVVLDAMGDVVTNDRAFDANAAVTNFRSARHTAIEMFKVGVETGSIPLPSAKGKKLEAMEAFIDEYTVKFYAQGNDIFTGKPITEVLKV